MTKKEEVISFKVDHKLSKALEGIPNRSEFIRAAISSALENTCPLCRGTGILTPEQREHWSKFEKHHSVKECSKCHAIHIVCQSEKAGDLH